MLKALRQTIGQFAQTQKSAQSGSANRSVVFTPHDEPKLKKGGTAYPSVMTSRSMASDQDIRRTDRRLATVDLARLSRAGSTDDILRELVHSSPSISAALAAHIRTAVTSSFTVVAKNPDGTYNREGTNLANQVVTRFNSMPDYSIGFTRPDSLRSISESFTKEIMTYGAFCGELILDDSLMPLRIQPVSSPTIVWRPSKDRLIPYQRVGDDLIKLDTPTFFYISLDQELMDAYASSPFESAIKPVFFVEQLRSDITRVIRQALHPRLKVVINEESIRKYAPQKAYHDSDEMDAYVDNIFEQVSEQVNGLNPEDALINFDMIEVSMLNNGNISLSRELETLTQMGDSTLSSGTKTLPTILGQHKGSSNIASTETLLFMKQVEGAVQFKLNEFYSKILTLAVRIMGLECYVEFKYKPIDLRPDTELEAFKAQKQSRVLELLSLGFYTDEQAGIELTGELPPEDHRPLSGTMFKSKNPDDENPYMGEENSGSALNQDLNPDTATGVRGGNKKRNPQKED